MTELNPNHPVTIASRDLWHKIVAMIMTVQGRKKLQITPREVERCMKALDGSAVTIKFDDFNGITLQVVSAAEAERLAREEGGLPV